MVPGSIGTQRVRSIRLCALLMCAALLASAAPADQAAALSASRKLEQLAEKSLPSGTEVEFSEAEVMAWAQVHVIPHFPDGVDELELSLREGGAVVGAEIDLKAAGASVDDLPLVMRLLLRGTRSVLLDIDLAIKGGRGSLKVVSMMVEGVEIPDVVLQWFIDNYAPEQYRPYLEGEEADWGLGLSELKMESGRAVATVE